MSFATYFKKLFFSVDEPVDTEDLQDIQNNAALVWQARLQAQTLGLPAPKPGYIYKPVFIGGSYWVSKVGKKVSQVKTVTFPKNTFAPGTVPTVLVTRVGANPAPIFVGVYSTTNNYCKIYSVYNKPPLKKKTKGGKVKKVAQPLPAHRVNYVATGWKEVKI